MRYGVAFRECVSPVIDEVLRALDARSAMPHVLPIWVNWNWVDWRLDPALLAGIRERGVVPVLLVESTGVPYENILAGQVDAALVRLARRGEGCVMRWDQEPQSKGLGADWYRHPLYVETFTYVSDVMRDVADVRLAYCSTSDVGEMARFYPGDAAQVVGFDAFSRTEDGRFPPKQWAKPIAELERIAPGKPIWVFECGRIVGLTRRAKWLLSISKVEGIDVAIPWDMKVPGWPDDFTWTPAMDRTFAGMVA